MKSAWTLEIERDVQGDVLILALRGRLGTASAGDLLEAVAHAMDGDGGHRAILVDLAGVDYMSSAGLIALDAAAGRIHGAGGRLAVCDACEPVRLVLEFGELTKDVPVAPTRAAGLERLRRGPKTDNR